MSLTESTPSPTTQEFRNYQEVEQFGSTPHSLLYRAKHVKTNQVVTIEQFAPETFDLLLFLTEAEELTGIRHPNILPVQDFGKTPAGKPFVVYAGQWGPTLAESLAKDTLPPDTAARVTHDLSQAVALLHSKDLVHGRITAEHILYHPNQQAQLTAVALPSLKLIAPVKQAEDLLALGKVLYQSVTGRAVSSLDRVEPPHHVVESISPGLEAVCLKALSANPTERYTSAAELAADLSRAIAGTPTQAKPIRKVRRNGNGLLSAGVTQKGLKASLLVAALILTVGAVASGAGFLIANSGWFGPTRPNQLGPVDPTETQVKVSPRASELVSAIALAEPAQVSELAKAIKDEPGGLDLLKDYRKQLNSGTRSWVNVTGALVSLDFDDHVNELIEYYYRSRGEEVLALRGLLYPYRDKLAEQSWEVIKDKQSQPSQRLRAMIALSIYGQARSDFKRQVKTLAPQIVEWLVQEPLYLDAFIRAMSPIQAEIAAQANRSYQQARERFRSAGTNEAELADALQQMDGSLKLTIICAAAQPKVLGDLLFTVSPRHIGTILPLMATNKSAVIPKLRAELGQIESGPTVNWKDPPLQDDWKQPSKELRQEIEASGGALEERFVWTQNLTVNQFERIAKELTPCGYRPDRLRPFLTEKGIALAAVWVRDGADWEWANAVKAAEINEIDQRLRDRDLEIVDVSGLFNGNDELFFAVWAKTKNQPRAQLMVGVPDFQFENFRQRWAPQGLSPETIHAYALNNGQVRISGIFSANRNNPAGPFGVNAQMRANEANLQIMMQQPQMAMLDLAVYSSRPVIFKNAVKVDGPPMKIVLMEKIKEAEQKLRQRPDNIGDKVRIAIGLYQIGEDRKALDTLNEILKVIPNGKGYTETLYIRAFLHAKLKDEAKAKADLETYLRVDDPEPSWRESVKTIVECYLGRDVEALKNYDQKVNLDRPASNITVYDAACTYAAAAKACSDKERSQQYRNRAMKLFVQALRDGFVFDAKNNNDDLEVLWTDPEFIQLTTRQVQPIDGVGGEQRLYAFLMSSRTTKDVQTLIETDPQRHLKLAQKLVKDGWRPISVTPTMVAVNQPATIVSIWHRPDVLQQGLAQIDEEKLQKQATAAVALLRIGDPDPVWPFLKSSQTAGIRSRIVTRVENAGVDPVHFVERYFAEVDLSCKRTILQALGQYRSTQIPENHLDKLLQQLTVDYRESPDAGLHASIRWLLKERWDRAETIDDIDREFAQKDEKNFKEGRVPANRNWLVTPSAKTMTVITGPVDVQMGDVAMFGGPGINADDVIVVARPVIRPGLQMPNFRKKINRTFAISATHVTVGEFKNFMDEMKAKGVQLQSTIDLRACPDDNCPVAGINWYDAARYCRWLSEKEGIPEEQMCYPRVDQIRQGVTLQRGYLTRKGYRLMTDAEYVFACQAGTITPRYFGLGDDLLNDYVWFGGNSANRTWPVGRKRPNDFGLFDMLGNAPQWTCNTWVGIQGGPDIENPNDLMLQDFQNKLVRGGGFRSPAELIRVGLQCFTQMNSTMTGNFVNGQQDPNPMPIGFRIVRTLD